MLFNRSQISQIQDSLGVLLHNDLLLEQAFVHRSYLNESQRRDLQHNERLEFLGDKVLGILLGEYLFKKLADAPEGRLTDIFGVMASAAFLSRIMEDMDLGRFLVMSKGEQKEFDARRRSRPILLANLFEAILGAIYLARGLGITELFLENCLFNQLPRVIKDQLYIEPKSYLQDLVQKKHKTTPTYQVLSQVGPDHDRIFRIGVFYFSGNTVPSGEGVGPSKQEAEVEAARDALQREFNVTIARY